MREKKTEAVDLKLTYQASPAGQPRLPVQLPAAGGVRPRAPSASTAGRPTAASRAPGTNKTFSTALNWTRTFGSTAILDTRAGYVYYHNEALAQGAGLNTSDEVGIRGANLDEFTSGLTQIEIQQGYSNPVLGFSASLPWDRSEKTYNVASTFTKMKGNHTMKVGLRRPPQPRLPAPGPGQRRVARALPVQRRPDRVARPTPRSQNGYANAFASFLLDRALAASRATSR